MANEFSRAILIEQLRSKDDTDEINNLQIIKRLLEMFPEYFKSLFSIHGTSLLRAWGYDGEPILPPTPKETSEKVGNKTVVKTLNFGGKTIKVLR